MNIEYMAPADLIPYSKNAKRHPSEQVKLIANSIKQFGFQQPIVVDKDNVVVIGHGRLLASKRLKLEQVPVVKLENLSEDQIKALRLADNSVGESEWNMDFLSEEIADIDLDMSDFGLSIDLGDEDTEKDAADPEIFQAALNGNTKPYVSQADGHRYTEEEWERAKLVAPAIQRMAEEGTVDHETLYRGESFDSLLDARRKYKIGKTITNDKLTSYATDPDIAKAYAGANLDFMSKDAVKVVIANTNTLGKSVGVMTDPLGAGGSNEIITPKGMKSYVKNTRYDNKSNILLVELGNSAKPRRKR